MNEETRPRTQPPATSWSIIMSQDIRQTVSSPIRCRMISCAAAVGTRCPNPSRATVMPGFTCVAIAPASVVTRFADMLSPSFTRASQASRPNQKTSLRQASISPPGL